MNHLFPIGKHFNWDLLWDSHCAKDGFTEIICEGEFKFFIEMYPKSNIDCLD